jgi:hypothetical protein
MGLIAKLFPKRSPAACTATGKTKPSKSQYRGVQINVDRTRCCTAVRAIEGQRFLSHEVPALPVDCCDALQCQCSYGLFNDRRTDTRRTSDLIFDVASELHPENQRNSHSTGRRNGD